MTKTANKKIIKMKAKNQIDTLFSRAINNQKFRFHEYNQGAPEVTYMLSKIEMKNTQNSWISCLSAKKKSTVPTVFECSA